MRNSPINNFQIGFVLLYFLEEQIGIKILQRHLVYELSIEVAQFERLGHEMLDEIREGLMHAFFRNIFERIQCIELFLLEAVDEEVIPTAIKQLQPILRPNTPQNAIINNSNPVTEYVGLLHGMGG